MIIQFVLLYEAVWLFLTMDKLKYDLNVEYNTSPTTAFDIMATSDRDIFILLDIAGVLELKEETIESLLAAACLLQLSQVIQVCCNFLMKQLHPSNCLGIRSFADAQGCVDLLNVAHNYTMVGGWMELSHIHMAGGRVNYLFCYEGLHFRK